VRYDRDVRVVLLVCLLACKDQAKTEAPKPGSASGVVVADAAANPLHLPALAGTPPVKTTKPLDAAKARELAKLDFESFTKDVRFADDKGVDLRFATKTRPTIAVTVRVTKCFDCLPMTESQWKPKADALRYTIVPELKDREDTIWETGMTDIAGAPYAWTYYAGFNGASYGTSYAIYYNDGVSMIRVVAEYGESDLPKSRDDMVATTPKHDLEQIAKAFVDAFVHAW
jgi:hypothetical protein